MSNVSLMPVPAEQPATNCANCGAALVADQRYCLSCGQPCSPVRLAFLDVLQSDQGRSGGHAPPAWGVPGTIDLGPAGYLPVHSQQGLNGWLRRNSGLLGLVAVLLMCLFVGLLVGHWASQSKSPGTQVYKIEGLGSVGSAGTAAATGAAAKSSPTATTASKSSSGQASKEAAEGAKETKAEKVLPTKTKKVTPTKLKKLSSTTGKQHQKEINELGDEPVEVGGG